MIENDKQQPQDDELCENDSNTLQKELNEHDTHPPQNEKTYGESIPPLDEETPKSGIVATKNPKKYPCKTYLTFKEIQTILRKQQGDIDGLDLLSNQEQNDHDNLKPQSTVRRISEETIKKLQKTKQ